MEDLSRIKTHELWGSDTSDIGGNAYTSYKEVKNFSSPVFRFAVSFGRLRTKWAQNGSRCKGSLAVLLSYLSSSEKLQYMCQSE